MDFFEAVSRDQQVNIFRESTISMLKHRHSANDNIVDAKLTQPLRYFLRA